MSQPSTTNAEIVQTSPIKDEQRQRAERIKRKNKEYREKNKEKASKKRKEAYALCYLCPCGEEVSVGNKKGHEATQLHINYLTRREKVKMQIEYEEYERSVAELPPLSRRDVLARLHHARNHCSGDKCTVCRFLTQAELARGSRRCGIATELTYEQEERQANDYIANGFA